MKKQYESPELDFIKVSFLADALVVSTDQQYASEVGGDDPPGGGGFGDVDDGF